MSKKRPHDSSVPELPRKHAKNPDSRPPSSSFIGKLSDEILLHIFQCLSLEHVLACQAVSRRWHKIATDPELWKRLYFSRYVKPRLSRLRQTRLAARDWWRTERTQNEGVARKDWKNSFK